MGRIWLQAGAADMEQAEAERPNRCGSEFVVVAQIGRRHLAVVLLMIPLIAQADLVQMSEVPRVQDAVTLAIHQAHFLALL